MMTILFSALGLASTSQLPGPGACSEPDDAQLEVVDPYTRPVLDGIVWYGTWEDGMAEVERTGKPVMLHMGSPREANTRVPGTW